jgi:hypothetical protein
VELGTGHHADDAVDPEPALTEDALFEGPGGDDDDRDTSPAEHPTPAYADMVEAAVAVAQWLGGVVATVGAMAGVLHFAPGAMGGVGGTGIVRT